MKYHNSNNQERGEGMTLETTKQAAKAVVDALRPLELTIAEVREVLEYINETIEANVVLK